MERREKFFWFFLFTKRTPFPIRTAPDRPSRKKIEGIRKFPLQVDNFDVIKTAMNLNPLPTGAQETARRYCAVLAELLRDPREALIERLFAMLMTLITDLLAALAAAPATHSNAPDAPIVPAATVSPRARRPRSVRRSYSVPAMRHTITVAAKPARTPADRGTCAPARPVDCPLPAPAFSAERPPIFQNRRVQDGLRTPLMLRYRKYQPNTCPNASRSAACAARCRARNAARAAAAIFFRRAASSTNPRSSPPSAAMSPAG